MGCTILEAVRFIQSTERDDSLKYVCCLIHIQYEITVILQYRTLDASHPIPELDGKPYDILTDASHVLPDLDDFSRLRIVWRDVIPKLLDRVEETIQGIGEASVNSRGTWQLLGGECGLVLILRLMEFSRRVCKARDFADLAKKVKALQVSLMIVLPQEAWRRWARGTVQCSIPVEKRYVSPLSRTTYLLWEILLSEQIRSFISSRKVREYGLK